ncbi:hypothetical protein VPH35_013485 [Triticum aestivum]
MRRPEQSCCWPAVRLIHSGLVDLASAFRRVAQCQAGSRRIFLCLTVASLLGRPARDPSPFPLFYLWIPFFLLCFCCLILSSDSTWQFIHITWLLHILGTKFRVLNILSYHGKIDVIIVCMVM